MPKSVYLANHFFSAHRKKEEVYLQRVKELDEITGVRDSQRQYHDSLRKQRLEEFMAGFQVIIDSFIIQGCVFFKCFENIKEFCIDS